MILRKPYAMLIKHFKLIHIFIVIMTAYLLYKTGMLLNFFNQYIGQGSGILADSVSGNLYNIGMFILPFIIIVINLILLGVMILKKKPFIIYIVNILVFIFVLVVFNLSFNVVGQLSLQLVDTRLIRMNRDFSMMCLIAEAITLVFMIVRATGFDIKKFNFGQDLQELDIVEEDNEEFELDMSIDTNMMKRNMNKRKRMIRYVYLENRFLIHTVLLIIVATISYFVYMNSTIYNKKIDPNVYFTTSYFTLKPNKTYLTNTDYKGNRLTDDKTLVVVELDVKNRSSSLQKLKIMDIELHVGGNIYHHTTSYRDKLIDLGHIYEDNEIGKNFEKQLLVFEIPTSLKTSTMELKFIDAYAIKSGSLKPKYITVPLNAINIDENKTSETIESGNAINFEGSVIGKSMITISSFQIQDKYIIPYSFCVSKEECYPSFEYLLPTVTGNVDKALLKLTGNLKLEENFTISGVYNLYNFITLFGTFQYKVGGVIKTQTISIKRVEPMNGKEANIYYLEVPKEMMNAEQIIFSFKIRNKTYNYVLK